VLSDAAQTEGSAFAETSLPTGAAAAAGAATLLELLQPMLMQPELGVARLPAGALQLALKSYLQFSELS
jgi:hypothetical protein